MIEVDKSLAKKWEKIKNHDLHAPAHIDIQCPNMRCRCSLVNHPLNWFDYVANGYAYARMICAACGESIRFFLIDPPQTHHPDDIAKCRILVVPPQSIDISFSDEISKISPDFVNIYIQSAKAELLDLDALNGMGYRKSLEFLIKDYLCSLHPDKADDIKKKFLGQCIREYVTDPKISDCAQRTAWLANDETHYVRKWEEHGIEDLKLLLQLTIYWIESELLTRKYKGGMPKP